MLLTAVLQRMVSMMQWTRRKVKMFNVTNQNLIKSQLFTKIREWSDRESKNLFEQLIWMKDGQITSSKCMLLSF